MSIVYVPVMRDAHTQKEYMWLHMVMFKDERYGGNFHETEIERAVETHRARHSGWGANNTLVRVAECELKEKGT